MSWLHVGSGRRSEIRRSGTWRRRTGSAPGTSCESCGGRARGGRPGRALEHVVLAVEEVGRVARDSRGYASKPGNGANGVSVHSQPLPTRSCTPQALAPAGMRAHRRRRPVAKSKLPCASPGRLRPTGRARSPSAGHRRRRRGGTPLRSAGAGRSSARRRAPRRGSRRPASRPRLERQQVEERAVEPATRPRVARRADGRGRLARHAQSSSRQSSRRR